jgi:hypothetical protein
MICRKATPACFYIIIFVIFTPFLQNPNCAALQNIGPFEGIEDSVSTRLIYGKLNIFGKPPLYFTMNVRSLQVDRPQYRPHGLLQR